MREEETAEERRKRWREREAKKADELRPKEGVCSRCGKKVKEGEYIEVKGKILCGKCYELELDSAMDMGAADSCGA
ncbi:MAG: LIM domain-containing protein [Euryarchaeota archaeon]|nr:LIM domain-containing protein [Euryarchaeota archaeon]